MKKSCALLGTLLSSSLAWAETPMTKESSFFVRPRVLIGLSAYATPVGETSPSNPGNRNFSCYFSDKDPMSAAALETGSLLKVSNCRTFQGTNIQDVGYAEIRMATEKDCKAAAKVAGECGTSKDPDGKDMITLKVPVHAVQCDAAVHEGLLKGKKLDFWGYTVSYHDNKLNTLPSLEEIQRAFGENAAVAATAPEAGKKTTDSQLEKKGRLSLTFKKPIKIDREKIYARRSDKNPGEHCYLMVGDAKIVSVQPKINTTWKSGGCSERVTGASKENMGQRLELRCGMNNPQGKKTDKAELHLVCNKPVASEELPRYELKDLQTLLAPDLGVAFK